MTIKLDTPVVGYEALLLQYVPRPLRNERQYRRVLRQVDQLIRKSKRTRAEEDLLELLGALVAHYEEKHYPASEVTPGELVAHLLEVRGVSRAEVARDTGIPRQTLTNIVNGSRGISKANRRKLADYFHVSSDLFAS